MTGRTQAAARRLVDALDQVAQVIGGTLPAIGILAGAPALPRAALQRGITSSETSAIWDIAHSNIRPMPDAPLGGGRYGHRQRRRTSRDA